MLSCCFVLLLKRDVVLTYVTQVPATQTVLISFGSHLLIREQTLSSFVLYAEVESTSVLKITLLDSSWTQKQDVAQWIPVIILETIYS